MTCGTVGCRCQTNPKALHGPYYELVRKVLGKTVSVILIFTTYAVQSKKKKYLGGKIVSYVHPKGKSCLTACPLFGVHSIIGQGIFRIQYIVVPDQSPHRPGHGVKPGYIICLLS